MSYEEPKSSDRPEPLRNEVERQPVQTTPSVAPSTERPCRRCGRPAKTWGKGYCGEKCRMQARRERRAAHLRDLIRQIEELFSDLKAELETGND